MVSVLACHSRNIHSDGSARSAHRAIREVYRRRYAQCFGVPSNIALEQRKAADGNETGEAFLLDASPMRWRKNGARKGDFFSRCSAGSAVRVLWPCVRSRNRSRYALKADTRQLADIPWRLLRPASQPLESDYSSER